MGTALIVIGLLCCLDAESWKDIALIGAMMVCGTIILVLP